MKFIHVADVHLDSKSAGIKTFYGQQPVSVAKLTQEAFISLIDLAILENVDFIIIAGDLFDSNWRDFSIGLFFIEQIKRLNCRVYYIRGNHDSENRLLKKLPFPENVILFPSDAPSTVIDKRLGVAIHAQSYFKYYIEEDLAANYPQSIPNLFNIGILHTSGKAESGARVYAPFDLEGVKRKGYDYWALGHVHSAAEIAESPLMLYSGVLQGRHIQETGPKGCYLIKVQNSEIESKEFRQISKTIWKKLTLDLSLMTAELTLKQSLINELNKALLECKHESLVLRLVLQGGNHFQADFSSQQWLNTFHCWITESFSTPIFLERIVDHTKNPADSNNPFINDIANFIEQIPADELEAFIKEQFDTLHQPLSENLALYDLFKDIQEELSTHRVKEQLIKFLKRSIARVS